MHRIEFLITFGGVSTFALSNEPKSSTRCESGRHEHCVSSLPEFGGSFPFEVYSGLLTVPGPIDGWKATYDSLRINYQFHTSQRNPSTDPVVLWHNGGPGSSSMYGLYAETGYFQFSAQGPFTNEYAWNSVANMLYLESPAGSSWYSESTQSNVLGFSHCLQGSTIVNCSWNDTTQASAYAHTIAAFFDNFPDYKGNHLYLVGESYFGQYGPNIARYILDTQPFNTTLNLKGLAIGNGCWSGLGCTGDNGFGHVMDLFLKYDLISEHVYDETHKTCNFPMSYDAFYSYYYYQDSPCCKQLKGVYEAMGQPYGGSSNFLYNIINNCPDSSEPSLSLKSGDAQGSLRAAQISGNRSAPAGKQGGYTWTCGGMESAEEWLQRSDVLQALHLDDVQPGASDFVYPDLHDDADQEPALLIYKALTNRIRVLIFSGETDACVPTASSREMVEELLQNGTVVLKQQGRPWFAGDALPAGYVTSYSSNETGMDFLFVTVHMAGHEVPAYRPQAALTMFTHWLNDTELPRPQGNSNRVEIAV